MHKGSNADWPKDQNCIDAPMNQRVRDLTNISEEFRQLKSGVWPIEVRGWRGRAGLSIKVRDWGAGLAGPVDESEGLGGQAGLSIKVKGLEAGLTCR